MTGAPPHLKLPPLKVLYNVITNDPPCVNDICKSKGVVYSEKCIELV